MPKRHYYLLLALLVALLSLNLVGCSEEEQPTPTATAVAQEEQVVEEPVAEETEEPEAVETVVEEVATEEATQAATEEPEAPITATPEAEEEPIYLAIIWHQHQPVYYRDPETGIYNRPWVRVHATKDYVDMAAILQEYPDIHATFNLTPSLIRQLDDLAAGARDLYWVYAEIPAEELTVEQKQFLLDRFFDTNREIVGRFPRYQELLELRDNADDPLEAFTTQDFRDLQILFNLAWVDPAWLAEEPLASLVAKGRDFGETDKEVLFAEHRRLIERVIPIHRELQEAGQIEVTMTPFAHPILPLLITTDLAQEALPEVELPSPPFQFGQDARAQVELGVALYEEHFGQAPVGMWPAEGAVAEEMVTMVSQNGIRWMASDEGVLARSLDLGSFTRNAEETVQEAESLYRPYYVQGMRGDPVAMVFRDVVISDKVGFTYSGMDGELAAQDFVERIHQIREQVQQSGEEGPFLVSVILDGENAWEHYENDGKEFLHTLYSLLSEDQLIKTVTPSEFLEIAPEQPMIEDLWPGSWISADYSTWIGEDEENRGWEYLREVRNFLQPYITGSEQTPSAESLEEAITLMYIAEGSDWFWWYGSDQTSGDDSSFDQQYRNTLKDIYRVLEVEPPAFLDVPIIPEQPAVAAQELTDLLDVEVDGVVGEDEWAGAGLYNVEGGVMASQPIFDSLAYGFDGDNLYLKIETAAGARELLESGQLELYASAPGAGEAVSFGRGGTLLGFPANRQLLVILDENGNLDAGLRLVDSGAWAEESTPLETIALDENVVEIAIPLEQLNQADVGDRLSMRLIYAERVEAAGEMVYSDAAILPTTGPAVVVVPDLGNLTVVLDVQDPVGDDYGPGTYTYPEDSVFSPGNYDITNFQVGYDDENIIFKFAMEGRVDNSWDSPNGLSLQTFDIYIDQTPGEPGAGGKALLPGRNLVLAEGFDWDYAIHAEGWTSAVYIPDPEAGQKEVLESSQFSIIANPGQRQVTIRVPKSLLGDTPEQWAYAAMVLGQEGFPAGGVMRARDIAVEAEQWRFGGAPVLDDLPATNTTRVVDYVWPETGLQEERLSDITPVLTPQTELTTADFAVVPMLTAE